MTRIIIVCFLIGFFLFPTIQAENNPDAQDSAPVKRVVKREEHDQTLNDERRQESDEQAERRVKIDENEENGDSRRTDIVSVGVGNIFLNTHQINLFYIA